MQATIAVDALSLFVSAPAAGAFRCAGTTRRGVGHFASNVFCWSSIYRRPLDRQRYGGDPADDVPVERPFLCAHRHVGLKGSENEANEREAEAGQSYGILWSRITSIGRPRRALG
jgi:hypothetical protein